MSGVSFFKKNAKQAFHGGLMFFYKNVCAPGYAHSMFRAISIYVYILHVFIFIYIDIQSLPLKWMATSLVKLLGTPNASLGFSLDLALSFRGSSPGLLAGVENDYETEVPPFREGSVDRIILV